MSEENKALLRHVFKEMWQEGEVHAVDKHFAADYVSHNDFPGMPPGREGVKAMVGMLASAFSDNEVTVEDQIAEGDKVVTRWSSTGTHSGEFFGIPATGKRVAERGIGISRIVDGKIVEEWGESDMLGMVQQLGVVPPPEG